MAKQATNTDVASVEVEIDRPTDRGAKKNFLRSDDGTTSISGSGDSGVLVTNNSEGKWFVEGVTCHALGAVQGDVAIEVQIRDGDDNIISRGVEDAVAGPGIPFYGHVLKPGWDLYYDLTQDTANSHSVKIYPMIRKPSPGSSEESGTDNDSTVNVLDDFENGFNYTGDTAPFSVQSSTVYYNSNALQYDNSDGAARFIVNGTGLPAGPDDPFVMDAWVRSQATDGGDTDSEYMGLIFGAQDSDNHFYARYTFETDKFELYESTSATFDRHDAAFGAFGGYPGDKWIRIQVDVDESRDPTYRASLWDGDGDKITTLTHNASMKGTKYGWTGRSNSAGVTHYADYLTYTEG